MTNKEKKYLSDITTAIEKLSIHLTGINSEEAYVRNITVKRSAKGSDPFDFVQYSISNSLQYSHTSRTKMGCVPIYPPIITREQ
jgi:hypothetical protein